MKNQKVCRCTKCGKKISDSQRVNYGNGHSTLFCKSCINEASRLRYRLHRIGVATEESHTYPVITEVEDPELRMTLIQRARQTVRESVLRKQERNKQEELEQYNRHHRHDRGGEADMLCV